MLVYKSKIIKNFFLNNKRNKTYTWILKDDIEPIRIWRNQQINILRQNKIINSKEQKKYFANFYKKNCLDHKPSNILFSIKEKNKLIGYGGLSNISWLNKRAEISFLLKSSIAKNKKLNEKYFLDFLKFVCKLSFICLKFNKVFTDTFVTRANHIKLIEKAGFKKEGIFKHHYIKNKKKISSFVHAKFK